MPVNVTPSRYLSLPFVALALLLPPVAMLKAKAIPLVVALCGVAVLVLLGKRVLRALLLRIKPGYLIVLALFIAWMAVSLFWAPGAAHGAVSVAKTVGTVLLIAIVVVGANLMDAAAGKRVLIAATVSVWIVAALLFFDNVSGGVLSLALFNATVTKYYGPFWFKSVATVMSVGIWPIAIYWWKAKRRIVAVLSLLVTGVATYLIGAKTATLAIPIGIVGAVLYLAFGKYRAKIALGIMTIVVLGLPIFFTQVVNPTQISESLSRRSSVDDSLIYRLYIWNFTSERGLERPILGWGVDASRHIGKDIMIMDPVRGSVGEAIPLHPHNVFLQLFVELGLPGMLFSLILLAGVFRLLDRPGLSVAERIGSFACFISILLPCSLNFSVWSSWWDVYIGCTVALLVIAVRWRPGDVGEAG